MDNDKENNFSGEGNQQDQQQEKSFTQTEVDRIVQERLAREKQKYSDHEDLVELANILDDFDYANLSLKEKKELLKEQANEYKKNKLQEEANEKNVPADVLQKIKDLEKTTNEYKEEQKKIKQQQEQEEQQKQKLQQDINDFYQKYPNVDLNALATSNEKFKKFLNKRSNKDLSLLEIYEDFIDIYETDTDNKEKSNAQRSTLGGGNQVNSSKFHGLTQAQRNLADENGISYERYAEILKNAY